MPEKKFLEKAISLILPRVSKDQKADPDQLGHSPQVIHEAAKIEKAYLEELERIWKEILAKMKAAAARFKTLYEQAMKVQETESDKKESPENKIDLKNLQEEATHKQAEIKGTLKNNAPAGTYTLGTFADKANEITSLAQFVYGSKEPLQNPANQNTQGAETATFGHDGMAHTIITVNAHAAAVSMLR